MEPEIIDIIKQSAEEIAALDGKIVAAIITASMAALVSSVSIWLNYRMHRQNLIEKHKEEIRETIRAKLNDFYGPLQQYLNTSREYYQLFKADKPKDFRTLTHLLNPEREYIGPDGTSVKVELTPSDKRLLKLILEVGQNIEKLITEKAGWINDPVLRYDYKANPEVTDVTIEKNGLLAFAKAHFQLIRLANAGAFKGQAERFKNHVFPREFPTVVNERIEYLRQELNNLT